MNKSFSLFLIICILAFQLVPLTIFAENDEICQFKRWLRPGLYGEDVKCLQKFLENEGFFRYPEGPTGYYGKITQEAVRNWQKENNIEPALGYFGAKSFNKYIEIVILKQKKQEQQAITVITTTTATSLFSTLKIPEISDNDLTINENGVRKLTDYLENYYYRLNINIDPNRLADFSVEITTTSKPEDYLFVPHLLIEEALNNPQADSGKINKKLDFLLGFYKEKIKAVQKLNVHPELKEFHKKMYIVDLLTTELIEMYKKYQEGSLDKEYLLKYLNEYKALVNNIEKEMIQVLPLTSSLKLKNNNPLLTAFSRFLELMFKPAKAQITYYPFGGRIIWVQFCPCSIPLGLPGFLFYITLPKPPPPPLGLFASIVFLASPFFYMWKQLRPPVWVLGNAWITPVICGYFVYVPFVGLVCTPTPQSGLPVYMMGTSLF